MPACEFLVTVARARVSVDSRAAALVESGDVVMGIAEGLFAPSHVRGELGEVVLGRVEGRTADDQITIFKSLGRAVEDVVAADLVFRRAAEADAGTELTLWLRTSVLAVANETWADPVQLVCIPLRRCGGEHQAGRHRAARS